MGEILGIISKTAFSEITLLKMFDSQKRWNDNQFKTTFVNNNIYFLGFASTESISDEGKDRNPFVIDNKIIVSDSLIYNIKDLRSELSLTENLTQNEIIIAAYEKWGYDCVKHFNGDFAIAIYDLSRDKLYCARDRFGVKPFYYYMDSNVFIFGSELKFLIAYPGFNKTIESSCLGQFLIRGYIHFPKTIFKNAFKLEMSSYLSYKNGNIEKNQYYDIVDEYFKGQKNLIKDYETAKLQLQELISDAIKIRLEKSTNVGAFLSGGVDSALMTALTQKQQVNPINTFTIGFKEENFNEAPFAKAIGKFLGTNHKDFFIGENEMLSIFEDIPLLYDEPFGDNSQVASMLVSVFAKRNGINYVITGDGGDEQFCGYRWYTGLDKLKKFDTYGALLYKLAYPLKLIDYLPRKARNLLMNRDTNTKTQYSVIEYSEYLQRHLFITKQLAATFDLENKFPLDNWIMRAMLVDMQTLVPGALIKVERAASYASISTRSPLLDHRINLFSFHIPFEYKYKDGVHKRILRDILFEYVPQNLMERPKHGFDVPSSKWLKTVLKERLLDYSCNDFVSEQGFFNHKSLEREVNAFLAEKPGNFDAQFFWKYLMFQIWYDKYICQT